MRLCAIDDLAEIAAAEAENYRDAWLRAAATASFARATIWGKEGLSPYDLLGWEKPQSAPVKTHAQRLGDLWERIEQERQQTADRGH